METNDWIISNVTLLVNGAPLNLQIKVLAKPVKPQVMLPTFQKLANAFTDLGVAAVERKGEQISCRKGCGACCRQPVPLAEVELHYIAMIVAFLPEPRRSEVRKRFDAAATHFRTNGWLEKFEHCADENELKQLVLEYFFQRIPCPFLEDESCSIHPYRPVACREYLVTSPRENCSNPIEGTIRQVPLPLNASGGVINLASTGQLSSKKFLPLIFALEWAKNHPEIFPEKTGEEWLADFFAPLEP